MRLIRKGTLGALGLAVAVALTGCTSDGGTEDQGSKKPEKSAEQKTDSQSARSSALQAMTAATEKTGEAKSAKVSMTMSMPAEAGGDMKMTGGIGWEPYAMDLTVSGDQFAQDPSAPDEIRMLWVDNAMYMDVGEEGAGEFDGKRWLKIDLKAAAEASGDEGMIAAMTGGLENMNQDPAKQMALFLESPDIEHVGEEEVGGVSAQHYRGTVDLKDAVKSDKSLDYLSGAERQELVDSLRGQGIASYDIDVWVNDDDYPVKMVQKFDSDAGPTEVAMELSDYGTEVAPQAPPASETTDLMKMLEGAGGAQS